MALIASCFHQVELTEFLGTGIWYAGLMMHMCLHVTFVASRIRQAFVLRTFQWVDCHCAWFTACVGCAVFSAVASPMQIPRGLPDFALGVGLASLVWQLPLVTYRLVFHESQPAAVAPTLGIYMAPCSLCCAGWLAWVSHETAEDYKVVTHLLAALSVLTAIYVFSNVRYLLLELPQSPGWASYTFPTSIFATAMGEYANYFDEGTKERHHLRLVSGLLAINALSIILVVLTAYVRIIAANQLFLPYLPYTEPRANQEPNASKMAVKS